MRDTAGVGTVKLAAVWSEARPKQRADLFAVLEGSLLRGSWQANTAFADTDQFVRHLRPGLHEIQYRSDLIEPMSEKPLS